MTEPLWTGDALVKATGGRPAGRLPDAISGISIDTRSLKPGEAYFAIKGDTHDGHDFASAAMAAGAGAIVVAESKLAGLGRLTIPMVVVDDTLEALANLGRAARARSTARIIAVTGSAGKTTTKEALRHVLAGLGRVHASDRSFNNHWGVPLTLARMPADTEFGIFEIGMNHAGEIRPLAGMVRPHVAIITLIAAAHLGHFASLDEIARAKAEIFEGLEPDGVALLNQDDPFFALLSRLARKAGVKHVHGFGEHLKARYRLVSFENGASGSRLVARIGRHDVEAVLGSPGRHMAQNALAVLGAADLAGADIAAVAASLASLEPEKGRGKRHDLVLAQGKALLIDESYNANPASMRAAIGLLASAPLRRNGRRIAVLGDMRELGVHSGALHGELADVIAEAGIDRVFLAGPEMATVAQRLPATILVAHRTTSDDLAPLVAADLRAGDIVMVKSSNGMRFDRIVERLTTQFKRTGAR